MTFPARIFVSWNPNIAVMVTVKSNIVVRMMVFGFELRPRHFFLATGNPAGFATFWRPKLPRDPANPLGNLAIRSTQIIRRRDGSGRGWRNLRGPPCAALMRWYVCYERTYSASSQS